MKQHTSSKTRRKVQMYTSIAIGVGLSSAMMIGLTVNGAENYDLDALPHRRLQIWPPPVPGFLEANDYKFSNGTKNPDYEPSSKYQETVTQHAGNVLWCFPYGFICLYMLLGLNTVCDAYFTGALEFMVKKWEVAPDVAGATFMAAGGSAPEFFTSIIGACFAESDVGFGTIVGSAVFNVLFVIGACGVAAKAPIPLSWWPLFRDCSFYIVGLALLAIFASTRAKNRNFEGDPYSGDDPKCADGIPGIEHWEAIVLFLLYVVYCIIMVFNTTLQAKFTGQRQPKNSQVAPEPSAETEGSGGDKLKEAAGASDPPPGAGDDAVKKQKTEEDDEPPETKVEKPEPVKVEPEKPKTDKEDGKNQKDGEEDKDGKEEEKEEEEEEEEEDAWEEMMKQPEDMKERIFWYLCFPVYAHLYYCTPVPSLDKKCGCMSAFIACFLVSLIWIAFYSAILVWLVTEIGAVFGIPEIIMGFTVLAAGTSIPDLVSSMAVAREGQGDMAVSSSIGSNIFDILVGLPIPWLIKILLVQGAGSSDPNFLVVIQSPYIPFYVMLLLIMVAAVVITIHLMKWHLNKSLGVVMVILYIVFLGIVLPTSWDFFTFLNLSNDGREELKKNTCL